MNLEGKRIAVTGATGFLGRYIVDVLLRRDAKVVGVVRNPDRVAELAGRGVKLHRADLASRPDLAKGFAGVDAVVSNAALFSLRNQSWEEHIRTNVEGTRNVFAAVVDAGVKRVVHVSSVAVYRSGGARVDEDHPQHDEHSSRRPWTVYPISKALSEQLAWRMAQEHDLELTVVRPCAIYGAHDVNLMPVLRWLVWFPVTVVPVLTGMPFVYAGDVAEAIALCLEKPISVGKAYNVTGEDSSIWQLVEAWGQAGGAMPWLRLPLPVPLTRGFDHSVAARELGWKNRPLAEGLRETFALEQKSAPDT
jgi:nucleoside-diphosphate-sugar epimerase